MSTSKHLITALEKSDWLDRLLILAALMFFVLVVLFILKQRIVDRGLRVALFWTRFIPSSRSKTTEVIEKGAGVASSTVSSAVASIITAVVSAAVSSVIQSSVPNVTPTSTSALTDPLTPSDLPASSSDDLLKTDLAIKDVPPGASISVESVPSEVGQPHDEL